MSRRIILITGGQRSGKSAYAEQLALSLSDRPVYVATAHVSDEEFRQRVLLHQQRRGPQWTNIEEQRQLSRHQLPGRVVLVDCVTLWLSNLLFAQGGGAEQNDDREPGMERVRLTLQEAQDEFNRFTAPDATYIFVTNELGSGGVSANALQRRFTDLQGWMNQYIARQASEVILMVSGIPVAIK